MTKFFTAALAASIIGAVSASPLAGRNDIEILEGSDFMGFDESLIKVYTAADEPPLVPEVRILSEEDLANVTEVEASPLVIGEEDLEKRFIRGNDDRFQFTSRAYPYVATGKLFYDNGVWCSGALVGPRHVLTAAHCLQNGVPGYFSPGWENGDPLGTGRITHIISLGGWTGGNPCGWKGDWAVLIIDQRKGDQLGYFGVKHPEWSKRGQQLFKHIGYPGDKDNGQRPYRQDGTQVLPNRPFDCDQYGPVYTDNDSAGGQSGGALWETTSSGNYIWGTLAVSFKAGNDVWAGWGSGNQMVSAVINTRNDFP